MIADLQIAVAVLPELEVALAPGGLVAHAHDPGVMTMGWDGEDQDEAHDPPSFPPE